VSGNRSHLLERIGRPAARAILPGAGSQTLICGVGWLRARRVNCGHCPAGQETVVAASSRSSCRLPESPGPAGRSHGKDFSLWFHRLDESARLFLGGALASVARLCFTGNERSLRAATIGWIDLPCLKKRMHSVRSSSRRRGRGGLLQQRGWLVATVGGPEVSNKFAGHRQTGAVLVSTCQLALMQLLQ